MRQLQADWLELNTCCSHSFALVGSQASYTSKLDHNNKPAICESIAQLEEVIGKIYTYFGRSIDHQQKWSSIRGCIKLIVENLQPALLACLQQVSSDLNSSNADRQLPKELLTSILNASFLFLLYFHHDLHEFILGPITKFMQHDHLSYFTLMETIAEKKKYFKILGISINIDNEPSPFSADNHIQTSGRSRLMITTLEALMHVRLLLTDDLKRTDMANGVPAQCEAIQCCHQNDQFDRLEVEDNCSRWLCNGCRAKLGVIIQFIGFCSDHVEIHSDEEDENWPRM
ncbi:unnamed protein product [Rotaria socialis]|uniref:Uncharacterized protein n=1 Tax=Rotaria socialis TaxID=392032 RepID=A0A820KBJ3_9BILA|nr:unnamed protein product [Rotaria socialis]